MMVSILPHDMYSHSVWRLTCNWFQCCPTRIRYPSTDIPTDMIPIWCAPNPAEFVGILTSRRWDVQPPSVVDIRGALFSVSVLTSTFCWMSHPCATESRRQFRLSEDIRCWRWQWTVHVHNMTWNVEQHPNDSHTYTKDIIFTNQFSRPMFLFLRIQLNGTYTQIPIQCRQPMSMRTCSSMWVFQHKSLHPDTKPVHPEFRESLRYFRSLRLTIPELHIILVECDTPNHISIATAPHKTRTNQIQ